MWPLQDHLWIRLTIEPNRDIRQNRTRWQNAENNDDITSVDFHPAQENLVLMGADDGLVSLFDTSIAEEDDSLVQAVTHGPIHKAGFLHSHALFALSSDQNLALHPVYAPDRDTEPAPVLFGDLRPIIPCEYVIDVIRTGESYGVATGSHRYVPDHMKMMRSDADAGSQSRVDIVSIQNGQSLDVASPVVLEGAHGEEIVRSLFVHDQVRTRNDLLHPRGISLTKLRATSSSPQAKTDVSKPSG